MGCSILATEETSNALSLPTCLLFPLERQRWVREWRLASGSATLCGVHIDYTCHWQLARAVYSDSWQLRARWITAPARLRPATSSLGFVKGVWKATCFCVSYLFPFFDTGALYLFIVWIAYVTALFSESEVSKIFWRFL